MNYAYNLDHNGIPIIGAAGIEKKVEDVISFFDGQVLLRPQLTPLALIVERLQSEYKIPFDFGSDLGEVGGKKILGKFSFSSKLIAVDRSLEAGSGRWNFTLAHELGHFVFHRKLKLEKEKIHPDTESIFEDFEEKRTPSEWLEWQANTFASARLMPRQPEIW